MGMQMKNFKKMMTLMALCLSVAITTSGYATTLPDIPEPLKNGTGAIDNNGVIYVGLGTAGRMVPLSIVIRGRILVIDGDEWLGRLLSRVLQEKGFATDFCEDAQSGFQKACDTVPDGIVCSVVLPDIDGFWVARRIRTEIGAVAKTPLVLLGDLADKEARIQGLHVGAVVK
ncbi:response regulator [Salmonella enterica subsp. enterica serovar Dessau]|uniref:Response regulator n=2 Tax=Salmonella enterica TaxID=28901 RepID=A0A8E5IMI1_SALET|nr:response regulator [Salmonella enterica subsp. enterica serovar Dessau]